MSANEVDITLDRADFSLCAQLDFPNGVTAVVGPSGCGKTTLLRCVAGLERGGGKVVVAGNRWQDDAQGIFLPTWKRKLGVVFQEASLFTHLTVQGNLQFALKRSGQSVKRLDQAIELMGISHLLKRHPGELSGGERQRVAIARAAATDPLVMLFDEPLASLDEQRKEEILPWLQRFCAEQQLPMLYVTHSPYEAMRLADHLVVLNQGEIRAHGPIGEVLSQIDHPVALGAGVGALLKACVTDFEPQWQLYHLRVGQLVFTLPRRTQHLNIGQEVNLRVLASDVALSLNKPEVTSVRNCFAGCIEQISEEKDSGVAWVRTNCDGQIILSQITMKSLHELSLKPGLHLWALIKGASLVSA